jgi:hypothetical protein
MSEGLSWPEHLGDHRDGWRATVGDDPRQCLPQPHPCRAVAQERLASGLRSFTPDEKKWRAVRLPSRRLSRAGSVKTVTRGSASTMWRSPVAERLTLRAERGHPSAIQWMSRAQLVNTRGQRNARRHPRRRPLPKGLRIFGIQVTCKSTPE